MKKSQKKNRVILSLAGICVVVAVVFVASVIVAHGCSYNDSCYGNYGSYGSYNYYQPANSYSGQYQYPPSEPVVTPITASCYAQPVSTYVGSAVEWMSSVSGGTSPYSYNITWAGDEGLSGHGSSISKTYNIPGSKSASMQIISGGQSIAVNCSTSVNVMAQALNNISYGNYGGYGNYGNYGNNNGYNNYNNYGNYGGYNGYNNYNGNGNYGNSNYGNYGGYNGYNNYGGYNGYGSGYNGYNGSNYGYNSGFGTPVYQY
jgi:hypothetical protein